MCDHTSYMAELKASTPNNWLLSDMEMEGYDNLFPECPLNLLLDDDTNFLSHFETLATTNSCSSSSWNSSTITEHVSPVLSPSPTSQILCFHPSSPPQPGNMNFLPPKQGTKRAREAQDHIMAERKRREKLSQSLIALAALIPGLKKMDKATVLGDAIKYVKELKGRLTVLEEEQSNKRDVVDVNKPQISSDVDDSSSCDDDDSGEALPHVEARVAEKEVLLRIHCKKQKGIYVKLLAEIQRLHLFVVHSSSLPFGDSILDVTIVAQMGTEYKLSIKDLVRNLRAATLRSMS